MQLTLTKHNHLVVSNAVLEGKPDLTPKPKFLENLEKFLERELKALRCETASSAAPSESRLQAHREVFEYLIEEFKTYKPLLSAIKNEYELIELLVRECNADINARANIGETPLFICIKYARFYSYDSTRLA